MSFYNIFKDKSLINVIPLFTALYLAYYTEQVIVPLLLGGCVIVFYLMVTLLAKIVIDKKSKNKNVEDRVFDELIKKDFGKINALFSLGHWALLAVTAVILYSLRDEFVPFALFWFLVLGFLYNFLSLLLLQWVRIKSAFRGE